MSYENTNNRGGYDGTSKIDSESIVQQYRNLRHQQKQFLRKINLTPALKAELFDLEDLRNSNKNTYKQKMVVVLDPFRGRLIMGESAWLDLEKQKEAERLQIEKEIMNHRCEEQKEQEIKKQQEMILNKQPEQIKITEQKEQGKKKQQDNNFINNLLGNLFKTNKSKNTNNQSEENLKNTDNNKRVGLGVEIKEQIGKETTQNKNIQSKIENKKSKIVGNQDKKKKEKGENNVKIQGQKVAQTKSRLQSPLSRESKVISQTNQNKKTSNIRTENKTKQKEKLENEIKKKGKKKTIQQQIEQSEQISSIHERERDGKQSSNNPSEIMSKIETDILQQILRQKSKKR